MMKSRDVVASVAVVVFLGTCLGLICGMNPDEVLAEKADPESVKTTTLNGKLVDLTHFMTGKRTESSEKKTQHVIPLALDTDKKVYVIVWDTAGSPVEQLKTHVGFDVEVRGRVFEKKGLSTIHVDNVTRQNRG